MKGIIKFRAIAATLLSLTSFSAEADKVIFWNSGVMERSSLDAEVSRDKDGVVTVRFLTRSLAYALRCSGKIDDDAYKKVLPALAAYLDKEKVIHPFVFAKQTGLTDCKQI